MLLTWTMTATTMTNSGHRWQWRPLRLRVTGARPCVGGPSCEAPRCSTTGGPVRQRRRRRPRLRLHVPATRPRQIRRPGCSCCCSCSGFRCPAPWRTSAAAVSVVAVKRWRTSRTVCGGAPEPGARPAEATAPTTEGAKAPRRWTPGALVVAMNRAGRQRRDAWPPRPWPCWPINC